MTITPTASPELPDLDHLEALARAATPGPWAYQEDSDAYTHIVRPVASPGWIIASATQTSKPEGEANGRWIAAANPAAVLALIALARRAQPASEATQTACTVPPEGWYCTRAPGHDGPCAAWPVAQQDAAPSNSPEIPDGSTSAPDTPEAPADDLYDKAVMLVRARGRASVSLVQRTFLIGYNRASRLIDAMEHAGVILPSDENCHRSVVAAQLDGGQEGSAT